MKLEDFIGSLKAHEAIYQEEKSQKKKMIALESQTISIFLLSLILIHGQKN
jgi:hypothetical protein